MVADGAERLHRPHAARQERSAVRLRDGKGRAWKTAPDAPSPNDDFPPSTNAHIDPCTGSLPRVLQERRKQIYQQSLLPRGYHQPFCSLVKRLGMHGLPHRAWPRAHRAHSQVILFPTPGDQKQKKMAEVLGGQQEPCPILVPLGHRSPNPAFDAPRTTETSEGFARCQLLQGRCLCRVQN